jgi:hypothetical protein
VTWDEGDGKGGAGIDCTTSAMYTAYPSCQVATIVVSPYITPGTVDTTSLNHYALLGTIEDIFGLPRVNRAQGQVSLRSGLGF